MCSVSLSSMHLCFLSLWGSIKDYYKVLGVDPAASSKEIGKAQLPKFLLNQVGDGILVNWIPAWKSMLLQLAFSIPYPVFCCGFRWHLSLRITFWELTQFSFSQCTRSLFCWKRPFVSWLARRRDKWDECRKELRWFGNLLRTIRTFL